MGLPYNELKAQSVRGEGLWPGGAGRASEGPRPSRSPAPAGEGSPGEPWLGPGAGVGNTGGGRAALPALTGVNSLRTFRAEEKSPPQGALPLIWLRLETVITPPSRCGNATHRSPLPGPAGQGRAAENAGVPFPSSPPTLEEAGVVPTPRGSGGTGNVPLCGWGNRPREPGKGGV